MHTSINPRRLLTTFVLCSCPYRRNRLRLRATACTGLTLVRATYRSNDGLLALFRVSTTSQRWARSQSLVSNHNPSQLMMLIVHRARVASLYGGISGGHYFYLDTPVEPDVLLSQVLMQLNGVDLRMIPDNYREEQINFIISKADVLGL